MDIFGILSLFGGLALFLFGMDVMGKALEQQAGNRLQIILEKLTSSPVKGFFLGLVVTAIIQSSSATTVMVVGFVNSGVIQLQQAVGVIMGSNVGTTVTSWLLSMSAIDGSSLLIQLLKPSSFTPVLAVIGIALHMFAKSEKKKGVGSILLGFAVLMFGMDAMSAAVKPLANETWFTDMFVMFTNPILGVLAGAALTGILQSSSASIGVLQALSATGAVTYGSAMPIIMGQNIGTCVTALISSVGANKNARRAAMVHLYFNIIGVVLFLSLFYGADALVNFAFVDGTVDALGIAVIHTIFNVLATAVLLPLSKYLVRLACMTIRDIPEQGDDEVELLDERLLATPALAISAARRLTVGMAECAKEAVRDAIKQTNTFEPDRSESIRAGEDVIDLYEDKIGSYLVKVSSRSLTMDDSREASKLLHTIGEFERIGDHALNILHSAEEMQKKSIGFSEQAKGEITVLTRAVVDLITLTVRAFEEDDIHMARQVEPLEQVIDDLSKELRNRHIRRLQNGNCTIEMGFILSDLTNDYERIADHCSNVAVAIIEVEQNSFDTHEYLRAYKGDSGKFARRYQDYQEQYRLN